MSDDERKLEMDRMSLIVLLVSGTMFLAGFLGFLVAAAHHKRFEGLIGVVVSLCAMELLLVGAVRHAWKIGELRFGRGVVVFFRIRRDLHPIAFAAGLLGIAVVFFVMLLPIRECVTQLLSYSH